MVVGQAFSAEFELPADIPSGTYRVSLSNGQASAELGWFVGPAQPHQNSVEIRPLPSVQHTFHVADFGCDFN